MRYLSFLIITSLFLSYCGANPQEQLFNQAYAEISCIHSMVIGANKIAEAPQNARLNKTILLMLTQGLPTHFKRIEEPNRSTLSTIFTEFASEVSTLLNRNDEKEPTEEIAGAIGILKHKLDSFTNEHHGITTEAVTSRFEELQAEHAANSEKTS